MNLGIAARKVGDGGGLDDGLVNALDQDPVACRHSVDLDVVPGVWCGWV